MQQNRVLFQPLELPCGTVLKNRIAKSAMSDSLGDGTGHPTPAQNRLYQRWAEGGLAYVPISTPKGSRHFNRDGV
jgi:2,4-dienoyl-CoA reductase-like NADH-dependent reductase (Old Yellow Enzyme family)